MSTSSSQESQTSQASSVSTQTTSLSTVADSFAPHRWAPLDGQPDTYARLLWGSECFYHQYGRVSDGHSDTVAQITISSTDSQFSPGAIQSKVLRAWLGVRFQAPLVAGRVAAGVGVHGAPAHLGCFVYHSTVSPAALDTWAQQSVTFLSSDEGTHFEDAVESQRGLLTSRPADPDFRTHLHVLSAPTPDASGRHRHAVFLNASHCVADAAASLKVLSLFSSLLCLDDFDPYALSWTRGDVDNLPVPAIEAVGLNPDARDPATAIAMAGLLCRPSAQLVPQRSFAGPTRRPTKRAVRVLSPATAEALRVVLKRDSPHFNVSHAMDAARHVAVWYLNARERGAVVEKDLVNFGAPIDVTRRFQGRWSSSVYYCSGTAAGATCVDLSRLSPLDLSSGEAASTQQSAFRTLLPEVSAQWRRLDTKAYLLTAQPIMDMMGVLKPNPEHLIPTKHSDAYTSLGILETILPPSFNRSHSRTGTGTGTGTGTPSTDPEDVLPRMRIDDFVLVPRMAFTRTCLHTWSRAGEIHLSVSYTDEYDEAYIADYLDIIASILRRESEGVQGGAGYFR